MLRLDQQINIVRTAQIGIPLITVFGIGGLALGLCASAIVAGFLLWEWQIKPRTVEKPEEKTVQQQYMDGEILNPKGPHFF